MSTNLDNKAIKVQLTIRSKSNFWAGVFCCIVLVPDPVTFGPWWPLVSSVSKSVGNWGLCDEFELLFSVDGGPKVIVFLLRRLEFCDSVDSVSAGCKLSVDSPPAEISCISSVACFVSRVFCWVLICVPSISVVCLVSICSPVPGACVSLLSVVLQSENSQDLKRPWNYIHAHHDINLDITFKQIFSNISNVNFLILK